MSKQKLLYIFFSHCNRLTTTNLSVNKFYLLTKGENYAYFDKSLENLVTSILRSLILVEDPISLNLFEDISLIELQKWMLKSLKAQNNAEYFNNQIERIASYSPFPFFIFLKEKLFQKFQFILYNEIPLYRDWIFVNLEILSSNIKKIIFREPNPHFYINFIDQAISRIIHNATSVKKCMNCLHSAKNDMEKEIFKSLLNLNSKEEIKEIFKNKLSGRIDFRLKNAKKVLFYLYLKTKIRLLEPNREKNPLNQNNADEDELLLQWNVFFQKVKMVAQKQEKLSLFEGTSLRHLIMQSIRIFEKLLEKIQIIHPISPNSLKRNNQSDYRQFLLSCHKGQIRSGNNDETYLIKLFLLLRGTAFGIEGFRNEINNTKNTTLLLLSFEALYLSDNLDDFKLLKNLMKKFFMSNEKEIPIRRKMMLLTGIIHFAIVPLKGKNTVDQKRANLFIQAFDFFCQYLEKLKSTSGTNMSFNFKWFFNLLGIYYYFQNEKRSALVADLLGLCFSFENRALFPETLLFQYNSSFHCISYGETLIEFPPYFMIPHSSMAKVLQLMLIENVSISLNSIMKVLRDSNFSEKLGFVKFFCNNSMQAEDMKKNEQDLKRMNQLLDENLKLRKFILFLYQSIYLLHTIFIDVPFNQIFTFETNVSEPQHIQIQKLLQTVDNFSRYHSGFNTQYPAWIIAMLALVNKDFELYQHWSRKIIQAYPYCIPFYRINLQYAFKIQNAAMQEETISKIWQVIASNSFDIYPTYNLGKYCNHWHLYQFPDILDLLLKCHPKHRRDEYLLILDYFLMRIPLTKSQKIDILEKVHAYRPETFFQYESLTEEIEKFRNKYNIHDYFKFSPDDKQPGYSKKYGYYIPEPRPSRLKSYQYVNLPDKIVI